LAKPFDNAKARQAPLMLVESQQEAYLAATGMTGELGKVCLAPFRVRLTERIDDRHRALRDL
jgi:hypothetical protein